MNLLLFNFCNNILLFTISSSMTYYVITKYKRRIRTYIYYFKKDILKM